MIRGVLLAVVLLSIAACGVSQESVETLQSEVVALRLKLEEVEAKTLQHEVDVLESQAEITFLKGEVLRIGGEALAAEARVRYLEGEKARRIEESRKALEFLRTRSPALQAVQGP